MGAVVVNQGGAGRRAVDHEINLVPMVDLLVCCISFLLITAVWSHAARMEARADTPGAGTSPPAEVEKALHVDMRDDSSFRLSWKEGSVVLTSVDVPRHPLRALEPDGSLRFPELARTAEQEWTAHGIHRNTNDWATDRAVVHTGSSTSFEEVVAVMDALQAPRRSVDGEVAPVPAFRLSFAVD